MSELSIENQSTPKVSVIVPVYNVEKYIHQCIDSILGQTFTDFELLLIDDGSPDNSGAICDEYAAKDARVRVFHQKNAGVSAARNKGIHEARGIWISFVDSDDYLDKFLYSKLFEYAFNVDLVVGGYSTIYEGRKTIVSVNKPDVTTLVSVDDYFVKSDMEGYFFTNVNKLYLKSIIKYCDLKFKSGLCVGEDFIFNFEYVNSIKRVALVDSCCYFYYKRDNFSLSNKFNKDSFSENLKLVELRESYFIEKEINQAYTQFINKKKMSACIQSVFNLYKNDVKLKRIDCLNYLSEYSSFLRSNIRSYDILKLRPIILLILVFFIRNMNCYFVHNIFQIRKTVQSIVLNLRLN